jgi:hypothetical protein
MLSKFNRLSIKIGKKEMIKYFYEKVGYARFNS